ncbi:MAG: NAD(P)/FAD-dependent oxidoreductase [Natrialbaceae archaeon]|nr:NAD(P)/FAD-dependent oxidoreductase [Natrialbaceae archaeon]
MGRTDPQDVVIIGGGVAGLSSAIYTARNGLETLVVDAGSSILRRNAHLENYPGFPGGVNPRQLLDMMADQAADAGSYRLEATVTTVDIADDGFVVESADGDRIQTRYIIAATKNETAYLEGLEGVTIFHRGSTFVESDERGRSGLDGLYIAGRLAEKAHQAIVCAGHGAEVAVTLLEDDERPFYHDWVTPAGYFTDRGRDCPPGCEEISEAERHEREERSLETLAQYFASAHPGEPVVHPNLRDK